MSHGYLVRHFNERFGQGALSYAEARDLPSDEYDAWLAFFLEWDRLAPMRAAQAEHDKTMKAIADAL